MMKPPIITPSPCSTRRRVEILTGCVAGLGEGLGLALGLGEGLGLGDELGLGDGLGLGEMPGLGDALGLGLGEGVAPPNTVMLARAPLRASSIRKVPPAQKVNENDSPGSRSSLSIQKWSTSRTRARLVPIFVQVTRVPALIVSRLGLKGPPPPLIATLEMAVGSQVGRGLGLGEGLALGDGLGLGLGEGLPLGEGLAVGRGVVLGEGLGDEFGPPTTVMVARTPLRASSIW
jgi:hypothetical protein